METDQIKNLTDTSALPDRQMPLQRLLQYLLIHKKSLIFMAIITIILFLVIFFAFKKEEMPIIMLYGKKLIQIDPKNTDDIKILYDFKDANAYSRRVSPDGKNIAYDKTRECLSTPIKAQKCVELGIFNIDTQTSEIVHLDLRITNNNYRWLNSSTLIYTASTISKDETEVLKYNYNFDELILFSYDMNTKITTPLITQKRPALSDFEVSGDNIYVRLVKPNTLNEPVTPYASTDSAQMRCAGNCPGNGGEHYLGMININKPADLVTVIDKIDDMAAFSISPNGKYVVYNSHVDDDYNYVVHYIDGSSKKIFKKYFYSANCGRGNIVISPDSKYIALCTNIDSRGVYLVNVDHVSHYQIIDSEGNIIKTIPNMEIAKLIPDLPNQVQTIKYNVSGIRFTPDSKRLIFNASAESIDSLNNYKSHGFFDYIMDIVADNIQELHLPKDNRY